MSNRKEEILSAIPEEQKSLLCDIVDEIVFLEKKLNNLKKLPFIEINRHNPMKQRNTPAAKLYKDFLQQYINCLKAVESVIYRNKRLEGDEEEESPLRKWFNANIRKDNLDA